jgi:sulfite exporter TauE/SafE
MRGFLLGLASGTSCLAFCAPVLIPLFLEEGKSIPRNLLSLLQFLGGRLGGYLVLGVLAWATGSLLLEASGAQGLIVGAAYILLAALLLFAVLRKKAPSGSCAASGAQAWLRRWPALLPMGMGFLAGLKVCPPLLLAFTDATGAGTLAGSLFVFLTFFLGTSVYFLPMVLVGAFRRVTELKIVAKFAAVIVSLYYLYLGGLLIVGGVT